MSANINNALLILEQLGGSKFVAMTGAKNMLGLPHGLRFKLPTVRGDVPAKGATIVQIDINPRDLYDMRFMKMSRGKIYPVEVVSDSDIYADQLRDVFTARTGLYTSLGTMRGKNPAHRSNVDALVAGIRPGDRVTIVDRFGVQRSGRAVMRGPHGWVLNMGGPHGTPAIANADNVTRVQKARKGNPMKKNPLYREPARRHLETLIDGWNRASIYRQPETDEYVVRFFTGPKPSDRVRNADYYTGERDDAFATARAQLTAMRRKNPKARKVIKRKGVSAKAYLSRPSQITRSTPSKRLKSRRKVANKAGYFPNPATIAEHRKAQAEAMRRNAPEPFIVTTMNGDVLDSFASKALAVAWAKKEANRRGAQLRVVEA
jgi:hypothetical protein